MRLFAANVSLHAQTIYYRGRDGQILRHDIALGAQNVMQNDSLEEGDANDIISQLERYGMLRVEDAEKFDKDKKVTVIFNTDSPVPQKLIERHFARNRGLLTDEGDERRYEMAVANMASVSDIQKGAAPTFELSVEENPGTITRQSGGAALGEGWAGPESRIGRTGQAKTMNPRNGGGRRR